MTELATSPIFFGGHQTANLQAVLKRENQLPTTTFVVHTRCFYSDGTNGDTNGEYFNDQGKAIESWLKRIDWLRERTFGLVL